MSTLRSDEIAAESNIEKSNQRSESIKKGFKTALELGGAAAGSATLSRVLPFLSEHIPTELAYKGISKISPKLGNFLKSGMEKGLDVKEGLNFIKEKMQKPPEQRSIIEQYSPDLFRFLKDKIQSGLSPLKASQAASNKSNFSNAIQKMMKDHKAGWPEIVESVFGGGQMAQQPQGSPQDQSMQPQQGQPSQGQGQPQQQQPGQGQQALMAILQKIQASRGG